MKKKSMQKVLEIIIYVLTAIASGFAGSNINL